MLSAYDVQVLFLGGFLFMGAFLAGLVLTRRENKPQREKLAKNRGGGYSDEYGDWSRLPRFWR